MTTASSLESQRERERKIRRARAKLRDCQQDRDSFLLKYPDHADAKRLYEAQIKTLSAELERLVRGGA